MSAIADLITTRTTDVEVREHLDTILRACPAEYLAQFAISDAGKGWVDMTAGPWRAGTAAARVPLLADAALGRALLAGLDESWTCRTVDLRLDLVSVPPSHDCALRCTAELEYFDGDFGLCRTTIRTDDGRPVAFAYSQFIALPLGNSWVSPAPGTIADSNFAFRARSIDTVDGEHVLAYPVDSGMLNLQEMVHGGVQAALLADGLGHCVENNTDAPSRLLSLNISYQRPIPLPTSGAVEVRARLRRPGRRVAAVEAVITSPEGKVQAMASASIGRRENLGGTS